MSASEKSEFENVSGGWIGVQVHDDSKRAGFKGIGLRPGGRIWLDEEEQVATANRPRNEADNPFVNGHLKLTASKQEMQNRRPIGDSQEPQAPTPPETPPEAAQADGAPQGSEDQGEAPAAAEEPAQKPEDEMSQAEIDAHNAKAAAARATPAKAPPTPPPPTTTASSTAKKPAAPPEQVGTPEATAKAGEKPQGQRTATEQVATPEAQGK